MALKLTLLVLNFHIYTYLFCNLAVFLTVVCLLTLTLHSFFSFFLCEGVMN